MFGFLDVILEIVNKVDMFENIFFSNNNKKILSHKVFKKYASFMT